MARLHENILCIICLSLNFERNIYYTILFQFRLGCPINMQVHAFTCSSSLKLNTYMAPCLYDIFIYSIHLLHHFIIGQVEGYHILY